MLRTLVVAALVVAAVVVVDAQSSCRHWCPAKGPEGSVYCCDDGSGQGEDAVHPGKCPRRAECPPSFAVLARPTVCAHDGQCRRHEKCCPDACLKHHTCLLADKH